MRADVLENGDIEYEKCMRCMALCVLQNWDIVGEKIPSRFLFIGFSCCLEDGGMLDATGNFFDLG